MNFHSSRSRSFAMPLAAAGLLLAILLVWMIGHFQVRQAQMRFRETARNVETGLESRLHSCENLLFGMRGYLDASGGFSHSSFHTYCETIGIPGRYSGLLGVSYGVPLGTAEPGMLESRLRREHGRSGIHIHPGLDFGDDAIVLYAEPEGVNAGAVGFNSASASEQKASLVLARNTGRMQASAPMHLVQGAGKGPGIVLRLPVYRGGGVPGNVQERQRCFAGYLNAVFLCDDLAPVGPNGLPRGLNLRIADVTDPAHPLQVSNWGNFRPYPWWSRLGLPSDHRQSWLEIGGRRWLLDFSVGDPFFSWSEILLPLVAGIGCLIVFLLLAALVGNIHQVSQRAQALAERMSREYRVSESRLRAIMQVLPDVILILDDQGCFREVMTGNADLLAVKPGGIVGHRLDELIPGDLAELGMEVVRKVLQEQQVQNLEYPIHTPLGERLFHAKVAPLGTTFNGQPCVLWAARDITEHRAQEQALRQTQRLESLGILAGGIAHDFNNILAAIQGYLNLVRTLVEEHSDPAEFLDKAESNIGRAADLARQLLAYSGKGRARLEPVELNQVVEHMTELLSVSHSRKVEVELQLGQSALPILGDPVQIQQVIMNLVANALEAIGEGAGGVKIRTIGCELAPGDLRHGLQGQAMEPGRYAMLEVEDQGCGMSLDLIDRIFDPFFTTKPTGRGLGLSAIRGILKAHRAGIEIQSKIGEGTCIRVYFPMLASDSESSGNGLKEARSRSLLSGLMLIAEDEPALRETAGHMVERMGMEVLAAADGESAWKLFQAHQGEIRAALLDLNMPGRSGVEVYHLIRQVAPRLPIVICSGYSREEIPEPMDVSEPSRFLPKPYSYDQLEEILQEVMG